MQEAPVDVLVAAFPDMDGASNALHELERAKRQGVIDIKDAAVLRRDASNELHISETADKGFGKGAVLGGVAGAVVGVIAGPIGWATLGGAAVGGLAAKLRDGGFPDERLRRMGDSLKPGSSAVVAVVEHRWLEDIEQMLEEEGADLMTDAVAADIAAQLEAEAERMQVGDGGSSQPGTDESREESR
jgi:uncharacterized membrane protein